MVRIAFAIFIVLHGLVHLLYTGQSLRLFELQSGMTWPDGSWAFSSLLGDDRGRMLAAVTLVLAAGMFVSSGAAILLDQSWWRWAVMSAALFSAVLFAMFWDVGIHNLDDKGAVGILINIAILVAIILWL